jgi:hypothetical protein
LVLDHDEVLQVQAVLLSRHVHPAGRLDHGRALVLLQLEVP